MSIQTTEFIWRYSAEAKWVEKYLESTRKFAEFYISKLSDEDLEEFIDETFTNYSIK